MLINQLMVLPLRAASAFTLLLGQSETSKYRGHLERRRVSVFSECVHYAAQ